MNEFTTTLLQWYAAHRRDLPWRDVADPYAVWLSEIILQQTRIDQGRAYWERFMLHYPTVQALAAASEDEVMRLWQGLGYYSRARNLHAAAKQIAALGTFPSTLEAIAALPGVGPYTAAAIASFAFGLPVATVDGNVYRVLARHFGIDTPINTTAARHEFTALAQSLLPHDRPADFNQAMMDFGATWCTPTTPRCAECPFAITCEARATARVDELPVKQRKLQIKQRHMAFVYTHCRGHFALRRRGAGDIWQGLWQPPFIDDFALPLDESNLTLLAHGVKHVLTHQVITADFYLMECDQRPPLPPEYRWIPDDDRDRYAVPRLVSRLYALLHE